MKKLILTLSLALVFCCFSATDSYAECGTGPIVGKCLVGTSTDQSEEPANEKDAEEDFQATSEDAEDAEDFFYNIFWIIRLL